MDITTKPKLPVDPAIYLAVAETIAKAAVIFKKALRDYEEGVSYADGDQQAHQLSLSAICLDVAVRVYDSIPRQRGDDIDGRVIVLQGVGLPQELPIGVRSPGGPGDMTGRQSAERPGGSDKVSEIAVAVSNMPAALSLFLYTARNIKSTAGDMSNEELGRQFGLAMAVILDRNDVAARSSQ